MKIKLRVALILLFSGISSHVFSQDGDAILGIWQTEHGSARIQIHKTGETYDGKLVWVKEEKVKSAQANKGESDAKPASVIGTEVLSNFTYGGNGEWEGGTVFDPRSGKKYTCKLYMSSSNKLEVRAYMGISLIGKSQNWTRVD